MRAHAVGTGWLQRLRDYWSLIKSLQTALLLLTGFAGFASSRCPVTYWESTLSLLGSLFLAISGSTVLNMIWDREIDGQMCRTRGRPLPSGRVNVGEALALGLILSGLGLAWAFRLSSAYAMVVSAGLFFDVVIYTMWLKRRTPWSIIWGGIAGGMPVLAGRVLGTGQVDLLGLILALAVLLWIPTHIMSFSIKHMADYAAARVPVFPNTHGLSQTYQIILASTVLAAAAMVASAVMLAIPLGYIRVTLLLGLALVGLAAGSAIRPSPERYVRLFRFASLYMMGSMLLIGAATWL